jgi:MarR family transcriptional regulator, organic hydroperoxide resistance regulator
MANSAFSFEKPEHSPGFLLWQTMVTWQRLIKKALDPYDISHAQFVILANVLWFEGIKQKPTQILIVRSTKLDKMTVSTSLKKLVADGLIKRREHESDTRAKAVQLTVKGKAMASELVPIVEKIDQDFFAMITPKNQQSLVNILGGLVSKIEEWSK